MRSGKQTEVYLDSKVCLINPNNPLIGFELIVFKYRGKEQDSLCLNRCNLKASHEPYFLFLGRFGKCVLDYLEDKLGCSLASFGRRDLARRSCDVFDKDRVQLLTEVTTLTVLTAGELQDATGCKRNCQYG